MICDSVLGTVTIKCSPATCAPHNDCSWQERGVIQPSGYCSCQSVHWLALNSCESHWDIVRWLLETLPPEVTVNQLKPNQFVFFPKLHFNSMMKSIQKRNMLWLKATWVQQSLIIVVVVLVSHSRKQPHQTICKGLIALPLCIHCFRNKLICLMCFLWWMWPNRLSHIQLLLLFNIANKNVLCECKAVIGG